jgi:hypothetical protein
MPPAAHTPVAGRFQLMPIDGMMVGEKSYE